MKKIGRYEIVGRLGRGGMSTVYKGRAPVTGRLVAVKILQPRNEIFVELVGEEKLRQMFVEEAVIMGGFSHDHVAKVIDCDEHQGQPFIVLEYFAHSLGGVIGESYKVEAPSRILSSTKTKMYLIQALKGLERLHFAGIVHRDIKPYNLMLTSDDRVKIIDFGLSRVRGEEKMAIPGMQVGSPYYAAPEQERNPKSVDGRADLYSMGVLAYRMLTGRLVDSRGELVPPSCFHPGLESGWDDCIKKALARRPDDRFCNALEMRLAVEALDEGDRKQCSSSSPFFVGEILESKLRFRPERVMLKDIRKLLDLDELLRPEHYFATEFLPESQLVILEKRTGLAWQRRGAGFPLDWQQAQEYVNALNEEQFGGREDWHLPTVEELRSILAPPTHLSGCYVWPLFEAGVHWVWSGDPCNRRQAWSVDVVEGYFERLDRDGVASVCAVSCEPSPVSIV